MPHNHFPSIGDLGAKGLGMPFVSISVFDHWLTEEELDALRFMYFAQACSVGLRHQYVVGENRFLKLYRALSVGGVMCNYPSPRRTLKKAGTGFKKILIDSLRERRLMDLYFPAYGVRVLGNFDRTDVAIMDSEAAFPRLREQVAKAGLNILSQASTWPHPRG